MLDPSTRRHTDDGAWWWSGQEWLPAWSADRQWWFNGSTWTRVTSTRTRPALGSVEWGIAGVWTALWLVGLVWSVVAVRRIPQPGGMSRDLRGEGMALGLIVVLLLPLCGYVLGRARKWLYFWAFVGFVWLLLLSTYAAMMLAAPSDGAGDTDTLAAAGAVIVALPLLGVVLVLAGLGALVSLARRASRRSTVAPPRRPGPRRTFAASPDGPRGGVHTVEYEDLPDRPA